MKNSITLNNDGHTQQIHELQWDHKLLRNLSLGEGLADKSKGQEAFSQGGGAIELSWLKLFPEVSKMLLQILPEPLVATQTYTFIVMVTITVTIIAEGI